MAEGSLKWPPTETWLFSPGLAVWQKKIVRAMRGRVPKRRDILWILSSGTSGIDVVKAVGLPLTAIECSARAVNAFLKVRRADRWLLTLPTYHVGGLGIVVRARLSGSAVVALRKWDAHAFTEAIGAQRITLTSLVPTQVHDLVSAGLSAPVGLRAIVVGGGALDEDLYRRARGLGWPVLPSYGLTECSSQVATAPLESLESAGGAGATGAIGAASPDLTVLPHVSVAIRNGRVFLKSASLCRWVARMNRSGEFSLEDPLREGWFATEDRAELGEGGRRLRFLGRRDEIVKIFGELVAVPPVEARVRMFFGGRGLKGEMVVLAVPGGREGHRLVLVTDTTESLRKWSVARLEFNRTVSGPERLSQLCWIERIPRGELGKVKKAALLAELRL